VGLCNQPICPAHWNVAPLAAVKNLKDPPLGTDTHKDTDSSSDSDFDSDSDPDTESPPICDWVLNSPVVCVLVARYYTISNRIKSLKVSITKRALQLPAGGVYIAGLGFGGAK